MGVAIHRASHQLLDEPIVFRDPFALRIVSPKARAALETDPRHFERRPFASRMRAFLAVRSRVAEDALAAAVGSGVRQYVVLGAGLDTFALRNTNPASQVFEVDHAATQTWKRQRLQQAGLAEPVNAVFVPVDFERDDLGARLAAAGLAPDEPVFVSWLGVTPYLEETAIWSTLRWVASAVGEQGGVAFDYGAPLPWWHLKNRLLLWFLSARVAAVGEPLRTLLRPVEVTERLAQLGFTSIEDLDVASLNRRYLSSRADDLQLAGSAHIVVARGTRS